MRALAALLFSTAGVLTGMLLRDRLRRTVRTADALCRMMREISSRALYLHQPLSQITYTLAQDESFARTLPFLAGCAELCDAKPFPAAWREAADAFVRTSRLPPAQSTLLPQLGDALSAADERQLEDLLAWYTDQFRTMLRTAQQTLHAAGRQQMYVCSAAGLLIGILIL